MKNIKGFFLIVILVASTLASTVTFAISPQTGKILSYSTLAIAVLTTFNGLASENPIKDLKQLYKEDGLLGLGLGYPLSPFFWIADSAKKIFNSKKVNYRINSLAIGGALGVVGSIAAVCYFNNQIKAQLQSNNDTIQTGNSSATNKKNENSVRAFGLFGIFDKYVLCKIKKALESDATF